MANLVLLSERKRKALAILVIVHLKKAQKGEQFAKHCKRSVWVKKWILQREEKGAYHNLLQELRLQDQDSYRNFLRMDVHAFEELLSKY